MTDETAAPTPHPEDQRLDLEDLLPTQPIIWGADDELGGWKDDPWTYEKWARVAGHGPMANGTGCEQCGYDTSMCMFAQFHDAMVTTVIRELDKIGALTLARPVPQGTEDSDYREQIARALVPGGDQSTFGRVLDVVAPLVEQLRQARADLTGARLTLDEVDKHGRWLTSQLETCNRELGDARAEIDRLAKLHRTESTTVEVLCSELVLATAEAEDARDGGLDLAHELAEVRESRGQYHKNWDAAVAANMTALDTIGGLRADLETRTYERDYARAELDAVGRAIEGFLGVEYGTPVESARALVERCADAESALDGLRATAVVLPEDWCDQLDWAYSGEHRLDLIESWRAAPVLPVTPDEHVREHDDAAPTRDKVAEAWADTWDGVDRTPEWVRVVEPCPVSDCTIPQVHGHEGYGLRFTPAAQPEPQGEPDEDWCGRFADDGKHYCPEGHNTVYQMFSGGREWSCADCGTQGTYPPAPADVGPRARLLTQPGGAAELKRQMDEHLASPGAGTEAGE